MQTFFRNLALMRQEAFRLVAEYFLNSPDHWFLPLINANTIVKTMLIRIEVPSGK